MDNPNPNLLPINKPVFSLSVRVICISLKIIMPYAKLTQIRICLDINDPF